MDTEKYIQIAIDLLVKFGPKVLMALVVLVIGLWIIARIVKISDKVLKKKEIDPSLASFGVSLLGVLLKVLLFISVVSMVGVATTSFVAVLGAFSLAVGLALQGSLANFAGGALILLFKPFKTGDIITSQGHTGTVKEISIFVTKLLTPHNRLVILPNGPLAGGDIVNLTAEDKIRVDVTIGIGYDEDIRNAREVLLRVMDNIPEICKDPAPTVNVSDLADSSVNLLLLPYAKPTDYWAVFFKLQEDAKYALNEANIEIPYPHTVEIHKGR
jgi:small conductance mechanosensitive channel